MAAKHFELTDETKVNHYGITLHRIRLTSDCQWGKKGTLGGWVEKETNIRGNAWISGNSQVFGNAWVSGNAQVYGDAWVYGNAKVSGNAWVSDNA